ncbi:MAG: tetratricopeptide repeat protein [Verrucomicrobiota bacterium]
MGSKLFQIRQISRFTLGAILWGVVWLGGLIGAQPVVLPDARDQLATDWELAAADRLLDSGLLVSAEEIYRRSLEAGELDSETDVRVRLQLAESLLGQGRYAPALGVLADVDAALRDDRYQLYLAMATYGEGRSPDAAAISASVAAIEAANLSLDDLPWFYLLEGLKFDLAADSVAAEASFERALGAATTEAQRAFFESLILREKIRRTPANETLAAQMREKVVSLEGQTAVYPFAIEYATILYNLGQVDEADAVITDVLERGAADYDNRDREQLKLLRGLILGNDTLRGRESLRGLIREGSNREIMSIALQLLARAQSDLALAELQAFLNERLAQPEPHPLRGQFYFLRSQLALQRVGGEDPNYALAVKDAEELLDQFPGFSQITSVYRLLAYAALQREPAQYRVAADFLIQLRDQTKEVDAQIELNRLIGDCYFMNGDYANAVDFYRAARSANLGFEAEDGLFLRLITAEVRSGALESALRTIDQADFSGKVSQADRWRAEWNVAQALQAAGEVERAVERLRLLLEDSSASGSAPGALDLRLRWLEARLSILTGSTVGVAQRVDEALARIQSIPVGPDTISESDSRLLTTELLLLQAEVLSRNGKANEGQAVLEQIRTEYPASSAAERSYLTEASYDASIGDYQAAQEALTELATVYPESELAPQALFEAALYCERRGAERFEDAVRLHDNMVDNYPEDPLVYAARLKQGDLLRQINNFAGAQIVYENLINTYPEHPNRFVSELSRADCMLALARENEAQLNDVVIALERIYDIPNLPIDFQVEAGYKWAFALKKRGLPEKAQETLVLASSDFLLDETSAQALGRTGRYWLSRILFDLADRYEADQAFKEARRVYLKIVAYNLPGRNLADARASALQKAEVLQVAE